MIDGGDNAQLVESIRTQLDQLASESDRRKAQLEGVQAAMRRRDDLLVAASRDPRVKPSPFKALVLLVKELDWQEYRSIKASALGRSLHQTRANAAANLRYLVRLGYLQKGPTETKGSVKWNTYRLRAQAPGVPDFTVRS